MKDADVGSASTKSILRDSNLVDHWHLSMRQDREVVRRINGRDREYVLFQPLASEPNVCGVDYECKRAPDSRFSVGISGAVSWVRKGCCSPILSVCGENDIYID